jgi:HAD superfamily hydrolase (TIGR01509 family)
MVVNPLNLSSSSSPNGSIHAVIFDFDGLILDTETPVFLSWQELYRAHGTDLSLDLWESIIGTISDDDDQFGWLEEQIGRRLDRQALAPARLQRETDLIQAQPVQPGIREILRAARRVGMKVGLASSSPCSWVEGHLARLGLLEYFDCIRARDDVAHVKPDPELYLAVLETLRLKPSQALVLEDSPIGVSAARQAGIFTIAIPNEITRKMDLSRANLIVETLAGLDLEALLQTVAAAHPKG